VEAIALTLPSGGNNNSSILGGVGGTMSSGNLEFNPIAKYDDYCIRELAFDLGVDPRTLKNKLQSIFN